MKIKTGNVDEAKTVRAGCGMRYDPEQLGEETGFDFSLASAFNLTQSVEEQKNNSKDKNAQTRQFCNEHSKIAK